MPSATLVLVIELIEPMAKSPVPKIARGTLRAGAESVPGAAPAGLDDKRAARRRRHP